MQETRYASIMPEVRAVRQVKCPYTGTWARTVARHGASPFFCRQGWFLKERAELLRRSGRYGMHTRANTELTRPGARDYGPGSGLDQELSVCAPRGTAQADEIQGLGSIQPEKRADRAHGHEIQSAVIIRPNQRMQIASTPRPHQETCGGRSRPRLPSLPLLIGPGKWWPLIPSTPRSHAPVRARQIVSRV